MSTVDKAVGFSLIGFGLLMLTSFTGWVMNINQLIFHTDFSTLTVLGIARIIGVFITPLGAVLGFC